MIESTRGKRTLIDLTGVVLVSSEVPYPYLKESVDARFLDRATDLANKHKSDYERYINKLFGYGNLAKRALIDQEFSWHVLTREEISRLANKRPGSAEMYFSNILSRLNDPSWLPRPGTVINLDDFVIDQRRIAIIRDDFSGSNKTVVSGNSYRDRRDLVRKLGTAFTDILDPEFSMVLPPHYRVSSGKLKVATAIWCSEGERREDVEAVDDDYAIALLLSLVCKRVWMTVDRDKALSQPHVEAIIDKSGLGKLLTNDSKIIYASN
jgi:hypothetical protein